MILILQIAAGIVLGTVIIQNLDRILEALRRMRRIWVIFGLLAAILIGGFLTDNKPPRGFGFVVGAILMGGAGAIMIGAAVRYSARGLGYLYLWQRPRVAASRCLTNLLPIMLGVHPSWHAADLPRAEIAIKVGDVLFIGLGLFLTAFCWTAITAVLFIWSATTGQGLAKVPMIVLALVFGICMRELLRFRRRLLDRVPTPPERAE